MSQTIFCMKLKKEAPGLTQAPMPGALGEKILSQISQEAWLAWIEQQTKLINEFRLSMIDPKARQFLLKEMQVFLFEDGKSFEPPIA